MAQQLEKEARTVRQRSAARHTAVLALLITLSAVGAYVKLGPGTIAFDSAAGFVAALLLGPAAGATACALGHLASAVVTGFPLTPQFHLLVALAMGAVGAVGGVAARRAGLTAGAIVLTIANGIGAPAVLALLPNPLGPRLFVALAAPLTLAAAANAAVALALTTAIRRAGVKA